MNKYAYETIETTTSQNYYNVARLNQTYSDLLTTGIIVSCVIGMIVIGFVMFHNK